MQNLLGVILSGGESKRMGSDKGLLPMANTIRAKYVADKFSVFNLPVVYSINHTQVNRYQAYIPKDSLIIDTVDVHGPLKGLLSVHKKYPDKDLLMLACDMLDVDGFTIQTIIETYMQNSDHDFYVYQDVEYAQPFCGIYTSAGLHKVLNKACAHTSHNYSLQEVLNHAKTFRLPIHKIEAFKNYNSH